MIQDLTIYDLKIKNRKSSIVNDDVGGAEGIRTPDLQLAKLPLYQLSYSPTVKCGVVSADCGNILLRIPNSAFRIRQSSISSTCMFKEHCP